MQNRADRELMSIVPGGLLPGKSYKKEGYDPTRQRGVIYFPGKENK